MNYGNLILKYPDITTVQRLINTIWDINQSYHDVFKWQWLNKFDYFLRRKKQIFYTFLYFSNYFSYFTKIIHMIFFYFTNSICLH